MPVPYYGDFAEDSPVNIPFNTFSSDDPSASVTITDLADADIKVHKDAHVDQIVTDGATVVINFDGITGNHMINIDTSVDAAYATGSEYQARIEGTTVDGATINAWVGAFSIERAGGMLALLKSGTYGLSALKTEIDANETILKGSSFRKNVALNNFTLIMENSSGTPTAGLTVTGQISKDGGALAGLTNAISEISNGLYKVNLTQAEMNADVITLRFSATGASDTLAFIHTID